MSSQSPTDRKTKPENFAARAGRWSATHRKTAIAGWFAFVVLAMFAGGAVGMKHIADVDYYNGESARAERAMAAHLPAPPATESVLVHHDELRAGDPGFERALESVVEEIETAPAVAEVRSPLTRDGPVTRDGHDALVQFDIEGAAEDAAEKIEPVIERVDAAREANPGFEIGQTGNAMVQHQLEDAFAGDLARARNLSLPITLGILLLAFGALVAAGIPVLLAITGVMATIGLVALPSQISPVDESIAEVILLIGMAVGVDYSLFYLKREREERAAGRAPQAALEAAAATSGRAVLISGLTVIAAMAGMLMAGDKTFIGFGVGTMMVVAVAMVGSLTVLPAMLSALGDRVEKGRVPLIGRLRARRAARGETGGAWAWIVERVLRRPAVAAVIATSLLVAVAIPALDLKTQQTSVKDFPQDLSSVAAYNQLQKVFPTENLPAVVVFESADVRSPDARTAIADFRARVAAGPGTLPADEVVYSDDGRLAKIAVPIADSNDQDAAEAETARLRDEVIPETLGSVPGATVSVSGMAAQSLDFNELMSSRVPVIFAFVLGLTFILLMVTFRSIVVPIKAIVLNLLSVGAAYGVLTLVFQRGWGSDQLGFEATGSVAPWIPLFLFVILFGLSMDYHVFIISRIRELVDCGMSTEDAVAAGIKGTAGVVTSAAAVMIAVFAIFGSLSMLPLKQMGVGLAVAVLIDATVIRAVLLPASMKLLGDWNWYLPKWLEWLPRVRNEGAVEQIGEVGTVEKLDEEGTVEQIDEEGTAIAPRGVEPRFSA